MQASPMESPSAEEAQGDVMLAVVVIVAWTIKCCLLLAMIMYVRRHRSVARKGDSNAARKLILPAFAPFLWILACATFVVVVAMVVLIAMDIFRTESSAVTREGFYCGHQFVFLLVIVFMHQKSVSIPALRRSTVTSLVLATYTLPLVVYGEYWGDESLSGLYATVERLLRLIMVAWYVYIITYPPSRASKKVIRELCVFTVIYQALSFTSVELLRPVDGSTRHISTPVAYIAVLWAAMSPLLIWRVLQADTEHWRGMGERACALENVTRHKHEVQEHVSSQGLHVLIEMHRKLLIDFAYLELRSKIGVGSSAEVFDGLLQSRVPVAIKVYAPLTLSDEVVAGFSQEAALCGALDHPNIVTFHGMCVYPPTICLVFELCQGSLDDLLRTNHTRKQPASRQQLSTDVGYMIDAARAVAYLHSFSPGFLHRDIKPSNFLVDSEQNVKLADFGESRRLVMDEGLTYETKRPSQDLSINHEQAPRIASPSRYDARESARQMTVTGTVDYMAPELINSKGGVATYGEASDVYSLAMTMWDILYPGQERYKGCHNHLHIFQAVLEGNRPELSADLHPMLRGIITSAWQVDPFKRPSAQSVVAVLEALQEEVVTDLLADCFDDSGWQGLTLPVDCRSDSSSRSNFTGTEAVQMMLNNHYVDSVSEALRMGRMWLDAGIMHHAKHSQTFTNDGARFSLDTDQFRFYQHRIQSQYQYQLQDRDSDALSPIDELVRPASFVSSRAGGSSNGEILVSNTSTAQLYRDLLDANHVSCACRRFGQRQLGAVKTTTKRSRFHRKKKALAVEETLLTVALLGEAEPPTRIEIGESAASSSTRQEQRNTDRKGSRHRNDTC